MEDVTLYKEGKNKWRDNRYAFMSKLNIDTGIKDFGKAKQNGKPYCHILSGKEEQFKMHNLLYEKEIYDEVETRFKTKAGDKKRVLTNTVASQPCCFNLFTPLKNRLPLASKLFSILLNKEVTVNEIVIEFTPEKRQDYDETIGDQLKVGGTDADVAIFYNYENSKRAVLLLEFKYIESEFSICSSYQNKNGKVKDGIPKKNIRTICNSADYYQKQISPNLNSKAKNFDCGYLKYSNWKLTEESTAFDFNKIKNHNGCPFKFSSNQLWRNMLLAEKVANARNLDEFGFWVVYPEENYYLWSDKELKAKVDFENLLSGKGRKAFRILDIEKDFVANIELFELDDWTKNWIMEFRNRYLTNLTSSPYVTV